MVWNPNGKIGIPTINWGKTITLNKKIPRGFFIDAALNLNSDSGELFLGLRSSIHLVFQNTEVPKYLTEIAMNFYKENKEQFHIRFEPGEDPEHNPQYYSPLLDALMQKEIENFIKKGEIKKFPDLAPAKRDFQITIDGLMVIPAMEQLFSGRKSISYQ